MYQQLNNNKEVIPTRRCYKCGKTIEYKTMNRYLLEQRCNSICKKCFHQQQFVIR